MTINLLLVEDEPTLSSLLKEFLEIEGYKVYTALNGEDGFKLFKSSPPDICIFDVMMPRLDGFSLLEKVRQENTKVPIIILTAKSLKQDIIKGLKLGADDYLTKPFHFEELNLRLKNILKRTTNTQSQNIYMIGKYTFNINSQTLEFGGEIQDLTAMETNILNLLYTFKNQTLERKETLQNLWGGDDFLNFRSIDVFISKLRKYLNKDSSVKIVSIRGKGYKLIIEKV